MLQMAYVTGTCNFVIKWIVYFHVSGNELPGKQEKMGEYETELGAELALVDEGFTRRIAGKNDWQKQYTHAYISRFVGYDFK